MASAAVPADVVEIIATEVVSGIERAVECWMAQIEQSLSDSQLTSLGRLQAVRDILAKYKALTGRTQLKGRS